MIRAGSGTTCTRQLSFFTVSLSTTMALMREHLTDEAAKTAGLGNCPPNFTNRPDLSEHQEVDVTLFARACATFKAVVSYPEALTANADKLIRAAYFPTQSLNEMLASFKGEYVRLYYGIDDNGRHLMFMAPTDPDGNALAAADVIYTQCIGEKPPCNRTITDPTKKDIFLGD